mmetsp:Transcript_35376/g.101743  ORF Transcript_35376/g.101743 Transcript_35376/m.101743 type:complete len:115 (+) Transcript_35376:93-437(+)
MAAAGPPQLSKDQAKEALDEAIKVFEEPSNRESLTHKVKEINEKYTEPMERQMNMMMQLMPMVQAMLKDTMVKYGFDENNFMMGVMQIQMHAMGDAEMGPKTEKIMKALKGEIA